MPWSTVKCTIDIRKLLERPKINSSDYLHFRDQTLHTIDIEARTPIFSRSGSKKFEIPEIKIKQNPYISGGSGSWPLGSSGSCPEYPIRMDLKYKKLNHTLKVLWDLPCLSQQCGQWVANDHREPEPCLTKYELTMKISETQMLTDHI